MKHAVARNITSMLILNIKPIQHPKNVAIWQQNVYHQFSTSTHSMMLKKNPSWVLCYYNTRVPVNSLVKSYKWNKYYVCLTSSHLLCESQSHPTASWPQTMAEISKFRPKIVSPFFHSNQVKYDSRYHFQKWLNLTICYFDQNIRIWYRKFSLFIHKCGNNRQNFASHALLVG